MTRSKFIFKEILWSNLILLVIILLYILLDLLIERTLSILDFPWFFVILMVADLVGLFYNLGRLKKMGIDVGLAENQNGTITKTLTLNLTKEKVMALLKQNVWKFKTENKTETAEGTLLAMKYYRLIWNEKIEILVTEKNEKESIVKLTAGYKTKHQLLSAHTAWSSAIRHINYFETELTKREDLHLQLTQNE